MTDRTHNISFNPNKPEDTKTGKTAPTPRKTKKDFKKILAKEEREDQRKSKNKELTEKPKTEETDTNYEDVELKLEAYDQKPKAKGVSLFDIATDSVEKVEAEGEISLDAQEEVSEELLSGDIPEDLQEESLSALFKGYGTKEKLAMIQKEVKNLPNQPVDAQLDVLAGKDTPGSGHAQRDSIAPLDDLRKPAETTTSRSEKTDAFPREQGDLSAVNPNAGTVPASTSPAAQTNSVQHTPVRAQELQEIVDQIVSKLYTLSSEGKTDTLIKLKHPPLFAGASVVIRSFESAKGEFNIAFENLTQAAKQIMDMQENQNSLKFALEQKGFTVHIFTATTLSETSQIVEGQSPGRNPDDSEGESSKERQEQEQEEETT